MMIQPSDLISKAHAIDPHPSQQNPNSSWVNHRGAWATNFVLYVVLRTGFSVVPGISKEMAWTASNVVYLIGHFILFHWLTGTPFTFEDRGEFDGLTLWEQMDNGEQFTPTKKFLTALPIFLYAAGIRSGRRATWTSLMLLAPRFLLSTHYTHYDATLFLVNLVPLIVVCVAKMPVMHRIRVFGINKTD